MRHLAISSLISLDKYMYTQIHMCLCKHGDAIFLCFLLAYWPSCLKKPELTEDVCRVIVSDKKPSWHKDPCHFSEIWTEIKQGL